MKKIYESCCTVKVLFVITAALVLVLTGILVLSFVGIPLIIEHSVAASVQLKTNTDQWQRFIELPIPIITSIYLFNITNADKIVIGETPIIEEIGPYVYTQKLKKNILRTENDDSVSYEKTTKISFDQNLSGNYDLSDVVTVLNPALLVLTQITSMVEQLVVPGCLDKIFTPEYNSLFITTKVQNLIFDGFFFAESTSQVGYACEIIRKQVIEKTRLMKNIQRIYNSNGDMVEKLRFSYLGFKTETTDGIYSVNRGINDVSQLGNIMRWNNSTEIPYYGRLQSKNNETCKRVRGTDSTIYPPHVSKDTSFEIFSTDICRSVKLDYMGDDTYKGIKGYRFEPRNITFFPAMSNPEYDCYCTQRTLDKNGESSCYLDGVLDVYDCFGAPLLLSFPHFLYADKQYLNGVKNLTEPDKSVHGIYLLIEPNTGTPLQGRKRVQLNVVLRPIKHMSIAANLPNTVLPLLWLDESADLTEDLINMLNKQFFKVVKIANGLKYGLIAVSGAAVLVTGSILFRRAFLK